MPASKHRERAKQIALAKAERKAERIDESMIAARQLLGALEREQDPYAMHKAVESLPPEVLIDIVSRTSDRLLTKQADETTTG